MRRILFLLSVGLIGAAVLISLGMWQVQRLDWKKSVLAQIETRISAPLAALPQMPDAEADKYLPVETSGQLLPGELHVLVSIKRVGPGYRIIAPFETDGGRRILLDRGFVPADGKARERALGALRVTGNLHWPQETDGYTPAPDTGTNTWFARDVPVMAAALGTEPVLLVARSRTGTDITPLPVDTAGIPNDHLQYAITWFSLALIWLAMTGYFLWRTRAQSSRQDR